MSHRLTRRAALAASIGAVAGCAALEEVATYVGDAPPRAGPLTTTSPPRFALVLGGGGRRGVAHVGVVRVLEAEGLRPDLIVGASAGSLVGAAYASGMPADRIEAAALSLSSWSIADPLIGRRGMLAGDRYEELVADIVGRGPIERMRVPLAVVATEVGTLRPVAFTRGDVAVAVRASSAMPNLFRRVAIEGREYVDAVESTPVPVRLARELGASKVGAVNVMWRAPPIWESERRLADVVLEPALPYWAPRSEAARLDAIAQGEAAARAALPQLRALLA
ncbi:MAG: patatin-like phospholipase family protein [Alphaproteobacteria bacterium]|nr:patatin-like phospholipase family protein [Alphaproteobacteria bacterium]